MSEIVIEIITISESQVDILIEDRGRIIIRKRRVVETKREANDKVWGDTMKKTKVTNFDLVVVGPNTEET